MTLDDINTARGCLQHMFLAETMMPSGAGYTLTDAKRSFNAIKAMVYNRLQYSGSFTPGATTEIDIITDTTQFPEFSLDANGNVVLKAAYMAIINMGLAIAGNNGDPRQADYVQHIQAAKDISGPPAGIIDEFSGIHDIGGVAVVGGVYGFNRGAPMGGLFVKLPGNGVIMGNQFWTVKHH